MKKTIYKILLLFILFSFYNCKNKLQKINILTDDISLFEIVDYFNATHNQIKVSIDFFKDSDIIPKEKNNIFNYAKENKTSNYDLLIGNISSETIIDSKHFCKIKKYSNKLSNIDKEPFFPLVKDYSKKQRDYASLYTLDFPVIIARKDSIPTDNKNIDEINIKEFCQYAKAVNQYKKDGKHNQIRMGFIPTVSRLNELDFYFIFNSNLEYIDNKYSFNTSKTRLAFEFYYEYDDEYNYGIDTTREYLKRYNNIKKELYLKQRIVSFDFIPLSNGLTFSPKLYKIILIKDLKYASINKKVVSILKRSLHKKASGIFVDYLYDYNTQFKLTKTTYNKTDYYSYSHIPVIKGVIYSISDFPIDGYKLEKYIEKLVNVDFHNKKIQKKFFKKYYQIKKMIYNGQAQEKDFLEYFSEQINK